MDDLTNNIPAQKVPQTSESVVWPTNTDGTKKKQKKRILYLVLAILLTISSALGSFYLSRNLNQASTPNAPESAPQAAQKTLQTQANNCQQGCGSDEYCDAGRCRKTGGKADGRTEWEQIVQSIPIATPTEKPQQNAIGYEAIPGYTCSAANCNSGFHCINANTCVNTANPGLSVANDIENCGGTGKKCLVAGQACIGGQCVDPSKYTCASNNCDFSKGFKCLSNQCVLTSVSSVTPTPNRVTVTPRPTISNSNDPNNCGGTGIRCAQGVQSCIGGVCVSQISSITSACDGILPDQTIEVFNGQRINTAYTKTCCVPRGTGIGVIPKEAIDNTTNPIPSGLKTGDLDTRAHWTNCAAGTTCKQGVGCIGSPTKTPDKTTNEVTATTTVNPTRIPTGTVSPTTTTTVTPTGTVTVPPTATPTIAACNESCSEDDDCSDGLFCDSSSNKCRKPECSTATSCVCPTETPEPTIVDCNESCSEDDDCSDGLFCDSESNKCRKAACSDEKDCSCPKSTPEPTIVDCNYKCNSDDNCSSGLICDSDSGRCRKAACSDEKDCSCPKPRKTDAPTRETTRYIARTTTQPTVLKEAGILDFPGAAVFGSGLLLTVIGILLAL